MYTHFEITVSRFCSDNEASCHTCVEIASHHSVVNVHSSTSCEVFQTFSSFRCDRQAWRCKLFGVVPTSLAVQTPEGLDGWISSLFSILRINHTPMSVHSTIVVSTDYTEDFVCKSFVDGKLSFWCINSAHYTRVCVYMGLYLSCVSGGNTRESSCTQAWRSLRNRLRLLSYILRTSYTSCII